MIDDARTAVFIRSDDIDGPGEIPLSPLNAQARKRGQRLTFVLLALLACGCDQPSPPPSSEHILMARQAALQLDRELRETVLDPLESGSDPSKIIPSYLDIVASAASPTVAGSPIAVKRTALRVRNPGNMADEWEREKLEVFRFALEGGVDPATLEISEIVDGTSGRPELRWMKPMAMEEACLTCHGDRISPDLLDDIEALYPADEATGYYSFEMGGAYSIRIPMKSP